MQPQLLRVVEAARLLNVSRWTIYRWIEEGRLKATKIGKGSLRVFHQSVESLVEQNRKDNWEVELGDYHRSKDKTVANMSNHA